VQRECIRQLDQAKNSKVNYGTIHNPTGANGNAKEYAKFQHHCVKRTFESKLIYI